MILSALCIPDFLVPRGLNMASFLLTVLEFSEIGTLTISVLLIKEEGQFLPNRDSWLSIKPIIIQLMWLWIWTSHISNDCPKSFHIPKMDKDILLFVNFPFYGRLATTLILSCVFTSNIHHYYGLNMDIWCISIYLDKHWHLFGPVWNHLNIFGVIWAHLDSYGPIS